MATVQVFDCTHDNIARLPFGRVAGYSTGSSGIRWTAADWAAHPGAVRIDQDANASDPTADVLDVERGAASPADCPGWVKRARVSYASANRPGQRRPAIYTSRSQVTAVVNALLAGGITAGVGLWIADWNGGKTAAAEIDQSSGPWPVIGRQYKNLRFYDVSVFSQRWIEETVAHPTPPKPPVPPGQWSDAQFWTWTKVVVTGIGLNGELCVWELKGDQWVRVT